MNKLIGLILLLSACGSESEPPQPKAADPVPTVDAKCECYDSTIARWVVVAFTRNSCSEMQDAIDQKCKLSTPCVITEKSDCPDLSN